MLKNRAMGASFPASLKLASRYGRSGSITVIEEKKSIISSVKLCTSYGEEF